MHFDSNFYFYLDMGMAHLCAYTRSYAGTLCRTVFLNWRAAVDREQFSIGPQSFQFTKFYYKTLHLLNQLRVPHNIFIAK